MRRLPKLKIGLALLVAAIGAADARVVRVEVDSKVPYGSFAVGEYVRWNLRVTGELSPPKEAIPDLDKAPRNARGQVEYVTRVTLIAPEDSARGNGALLVDIPNRGRAVAQSVYNSPRRDPIPVGSFDQGIGFLQDHGFTTAAIAWEQGMGAELPTFLDSDGKSRHIEAAALAVVRDVTDFLANPSADEAGNHNPLAGKTKRTLALGYSQTGRFLRSFVLQGFNKVDRRQLFQGMLVLGSSHILLRSLPGSESGAGAIPTFADPEIRGVAEEPLAIADVNRQWRSAGASAPLTIFVNTTTDYFSLRASFARTGGSGTTERPLPGNVRVYDLAGASHSLVTGKSECKYPYAVLDWHPIMRAMLLALDRWVATGTLPPPSRLMPLIPATESSMALKAPAHLPSAATLVPVLDQDGNAIGGVRLPDVVAPLGTHAVQNPPLSLNCSLRAAYIPFARTKEERESDGGDQRLSLEERYADRNDYVNRIRKATRELEAQGMLLSEDAAEIINSAAEVAIPTHTPPKN